MTQDVSLLQYRVYQWRKCMAPLFDWHSNRRVKPTKHICHFLSADKSHSKPFPARRSALAELRDGSICVWEHSICLPWQQTRYNGHEFASIIYDARTLWHFVIVKKRKEDIKGREKRRKSCCPCYLFVGESTCPSLSVFPEFLSARLSVEKMVTGGRQRCFRCLWSI